MSMNMKFKELKPYISVIDRISMCTRETLGYENYSNVSYIPEKYDDKYVYGVGTAEVEFKIDQYTTKAEIEEGSIGNNMILAKCIEIMVSDVPRDEYDQPSNFFDYCYTETRYHD